MQTRIFFRRQVLPRENHHWQIAQRRSVAEALQYFKSRHVRKSQVEHHAIERLLLNGRERLRAGRRNFHVNIFVAQQFANAELLGGIIFHDQ